MDFAQVVVPVIVISPLIVFIVVTMRRKPAAPDAIPVLQPSPHHPLQRLERATLRSTTVSRELSLSARYEKSLTRILNNRGRPGAHLQLPSVPELFIGRRPELARAFALLDTPEPPRSLAITSAQAVSGVGRTGFVAVLAQLLVERFPDAQVFIDFKNHEPDQASPDVVEVMRHVLRTLSPKAALPENLSELPALYQKSLEGRRVLILVENIRPQPFLEILHPPVGSLLLLTSREAIAFARIDTISIEPFSRLDARNFLRSSGSRVAREPDRHLDQLAELSGFLPEALRLNAKQLQENQAQSFDVLIDRLKKADAARQPLEAARSLVENASARAERPAKQVEETDLVLVAESLPAVAAEKPKPVHTWKSARAFVQRFQTRSESDFSLTDVPAAFADPSRGPAPDYADALRFLAEYPGTIAEEPPQAEWLEAAVSASRALGNRANETLALATLGKARMKAGEARLAVACFERWVEFARENGDRNAEADALGWLGVGWSESGLPTRATGCFEAQLRIAREVGNRAFEMQALGKLGATKSALGQFQDAATLHGEQLRAAMEIKDRAGELDALEQLGVAWTRLKEIEKAAGFHEEQLLAARETGDLSAESRALGHLGQVAVHRGKIDDAIEKYEEQLDVANRIDDLPAQSHAHASLGVAWARQGDLRKAVAHYEQQLHIAQKLGNRLGEATAHSNIGSGLERLGDFAGAASAWEKALAIYESLGSPSADSMRRWLERVRKLMEPLTNAEER